MKEIQILLLNEEKKWNNVSAVIISNEYHLRRIETMINSYKELHDLNARISFGRLKILSAEKICINNDAQQWKQIIDESYQSDAMKDRILLEERGVEDILNGRYKSMKFFWRLRKADIGDKEFLFDLRNDSVVRGASLESNEIDMNAHTQWFNEKMVSGDSVLFIADMPIVQVRFDFPDDETALVNIAVAENVRNMGYGSRVLSEASDAIFSNFQRIRCINAFIKLDNHMSIRSFEKAGYRHCGEAIQKGVVCAKMILERQHKTY